MKAIRPKMKEFFHGRSLFFVSVGPDRERTKLEASLQIGKCLTRPFDAKIYIREKAFFVEAEFKSSFWEGSTYKCRRSLGDMAVQWHGGRNLHRCFTKEKQARKYINRINSGCLSAFERNHLAESLKWGRAY